MTYNVFSGTLNPTHFTSPGGRPPPWGGGNGVPSNTKSPGPRPSSIPCNMLIHAAIWPQQIWAENWGLCPFGRGGAGSHLIQNGHCRGLAAYQVSSWSVQPWLDKNRCLSHDVATWHWSQTAAVFMRTACWCHLAYPQDRWIAWQTAWRCQAASHFFVKMTQFLIKLSSQVWH